MSVNKLTPREALLLSLYPVSLEFGCTVDDILGSSRTMQIRRARRKSIYIIWKTTNWNYSKVGRFFKKDHTTIMYSLGIYMLDHGNPNHQLIDFSKTISERNRNNKSIRKLKQTA